ncbi:MFS transporter [Microbacterium azadirachtae]|uniref:Major Facilitator Superfamily protein n=1 Tax=Microbacterium azadirachtae TaxID=582680 RepID=A0A0F0LVQ5_9MICO|nr:MFS transporter [Microbacterium azadirachtae]KJL36764.1 Major Facilitator Superfamily protein [Microbacterium azadirachtae]
MTITPPDPAAGIAPTGLIRAEAPAAGDPAASPPATKRLLPGLLAASLTLFATYGGLIAILLPSQIAVLDPAHKVQNLAIVTTTSFVFTLFAQPLAGAFSDRTRSRFGRRAPWMVMGALVGGILLFGMGSLQDVFWITVFWVAIQVALNFLQAPLTTITADRFPRAKRGGASAMIGLGTQLGMTVGVMIAAALGAQIGIGYSVFGIAVIVVTVLFVVFNKDWSSKNAAVAPFRWGPFFRGFWINPRKHPDFAWAFAARFLLILGYFAVTAYQLYLLTDYIGMSLAEAQGATLTLTLIPLVPTMAAIALSGWWSDKVGRRKVFIYAATVVMVIGLSFPLMMPNMTGMIIMSVVNGIGFGLYMSVDAALMTEVLPSEGTDAGKDLGILNVATNIPQALSAPIAAVIIGSFGGYPMLFVFAMVFAVLAAIVTAPIRSVK